jgi:transcription elongation factor GreB
VSKAFTREDGAELPLIVPSRAPLPEGVPNYVTARGLARLREELAELGLDRGNVERDLEGVNRTQALAALAVRRAELEHRIASAELVSPPLGPVDTVRFGATVAVDGEGGVRRYLIVGVDEADASRGRIAFVSPLARALLGRAVGDTVHVRTPRGEEDLEIVSVGYGLQSDDSLG